MAQRGLIAAQISEIAAGAAYEHARVALNQVSGQILETYHVSLDEALRGEVPEKSVAPPERSATPRE